MIATASKAKSGDESELVAAMLGADTYEQDRNDLFRTVNIELTQEQKDRIKALRTQFPDKLRRLGKIHQVENGVLSGDQFNPAEVFSNNKIEAILDLAVEFPRMVVFAKFTEQIHQIETALRKAKYTVVLMTGATKERGKLLRSVNLSKECIFIVQAQISSGWELPGPTEDEPEFQNFPVMVFASRTNAFVDYDQALGRIQRAKNIKKNLNIFTDVYTYLLCIEAGLGREYIK
jgi:hypothetical protein